MPPAPTLDRNSRLAYGLLAGAFVFMAIFAVERTLRLEARLADEQRQRAEAQLTGALALWEDQQLDRVRAEVLALAADPVPYVAAPGPEVAAAYLWRRGEGGRPGTVLHPAADPGEDIAALLADPCMVDAARAATPDADRVDIGRAWLRCGDRPAPVALLARSRAADQLLAAGRADLAIAALEDTPIPLFPSPAERQALGLSVERVVVRQLQLAEARKAAGQVEQARTLLLAVGHDLLVQPGPVLERTLPYLDYPVLDDLRAMGMQVEADELEAAGRPTRDRLDAWREIVRVSSSEADVGAPLLQVSPSPGGPPLVASVVGDPFGERRHLLVVVPLPDGRSAGLQLDPAAMLAELAGALPGRDLRVLDAQGLVVSPSGGDPGPLQAQVPFGRLFPELRLAMAPDASAPPPDRGWRVSQLMPIAVLTLLAAGALGARLRADRQLRELWERQQAFVNRVSHELKTPLAGVKVMAELVDMGIVTEPEEVRQSAQRIITEVSRMEDRVNEVLRLARRAEISRREPLDLQDMASDLVEIWAPRFEQRGARLTAELEATAPVQGDRALIRDAMSNLLDNALKYLDEGRPGLVRVRTAMAGRWVVYEVTDNGIGVPEPMRRAIFERFTRVEGEGRGKAGGHGLGLAFVAEAIESHGGKVECRDGITGGARFVIRLRRS